MLHRCHIGRIGVAPALQMRYIGTELGGGWVNVKRNVSQFVIGHQGTVPKVCNAQVIGFIITLYSALIMMALRPLSLCNGYVTRNMFHFL